MLTRFHHHIVKGTIFFTLLSFHFTRCEDTLCNSCSCDSGKEGVVSVKCIGIGLISIPALYLWPTNTSALDLSANSLQKLELFEHNDQLRMLNLSRNILYLIEPLYFSRFSVLGVLDVSYNKLGELHDQTFEAMFSLKILNLRNNQLQSLPDQIFRDLINLEQMVLSGNPLRYLHRRWFENLECLRLLDVSFIQAHSLEDGVFHGLRNLQHLDLSGNDFEAVPNSGLRSSATTKSLILSQNPIRKLSAESFQKLSNIEELYLNNMPELEYVQTKTFAQLKYMSVLSMQSNQRLNHIEAGAITGASNNGTFYLQKLNLSHNSLTLLDKEARLWCAIPLLDLRNNPWHCSCSMTWIVNCSLHPELTSDLICDSPASLKGRKLKDLTEDSFQCDLPFALQQVPTRSAQLVSLALGLVVTTLIILALVIAVAHRRILHWWQSRKRGSGAIYYVKAQTRPNDFRYP